MLPPPRLTPAARREQPPLYLPGTRKEAASDGSVSHPRERTAEGGASGEPDCLNVMSAQHPRDGRGNDSSSRRRTGSQQVLGNVQGSDRLFPGNRGKVVQERLEAITSGQVVEQVLDGDARANEDRRSTQNLRVAPDDRFKSGRGYLPAWPTMVHRFGVRRLRGRRHPR